MTSKSLFEKITLLSNGLPSLNRLAELAASTGGIGRKTLWYRGHVTHVFPNGDVSIMYPETGGHTIIRQNKLLKTVWRYQDSRTEMERAADEFLAKQNIVAENADELKVARLMYEGGFYASRPPTTGGDKFEEHC